MVEIPGCVSPGILVLIFCCEGNNELQRQKVHCQDNSGLLPRSIGKNTGLKKPSVLELQDSRLMF
jgi:hypothetical protein